MTEHDKAQAQRADNLAGILLLLLVSLFGSGLALWYVHDRYGWLFVALVVVYWLVRWGRRSLWGRLIMRRISRSADRHGVSDEGAREIAEREEGARLDAAYIAKMDAELERRRLERERREQEMRDKERR